jgi:hypothetical protein
MSKLDEYQEYVGTRNYWGIPIADLGWRCENGELIDPDRMKPVVDLVSNRLFGIKPDGEVVVVHSYGDYRPGGALDFAKYAWNRPEDWEPSKQEKLVRCLGEVCCSEKPETELASNWRITSIVNDDYEDGKIGMVQARIVIPGEVPDNDLEIGPEHIMFVSFYPEDETPYGSQYVDTLSACIERFGAPYDIDTGIVNPVYSHIYRAKPKIPTNQLDITTRF